MTAHPNIRTVFVLAAALVLGACGSDEPNSAPTGGDQPAAACHESDPDCVDTVTDPADADPDAVDEAALIERADELLGTHEDELPEGVRVARRGEQTFLLTEDHVVGRMTVELDQAGGQDGFTVTRVQLELTDQVHVVTE